MKLRFITSFVVTVCPLLVNGQGSLTPPGAPAPTMKTLAQIEARTPISSAPFTITTPGAYYLTTNLTVATGNGVIIATNNVSVDLNGFEITSTASPAGGYGVEFSGNGRRHIVVCNGFIQSGITNNGSGTFSGTGFASGIGYNAALPSAIQVKNVNVTGCATSGILLGTDNGTIAESCLVTTCGGSGITAATIRGCSATDCLAEAIYGQQVSDSHGESITGYGVYSQTAQNCYGATGGTVDAVYGAVLQNCWGNATGSGTGIHALECALNCFGQSQTGTGLRAVAASASVGGHPAGGVAIQATLANGCYNVNGGTNTILFKYNMP